MVFRPSGQEQRTYIILDIVKNTPPRYGGGGGGLLFTRSYVNTQVKHSLVHLVWDRVQYRFCMLLFRQGRGRGFW